MSELNHFYFDLDSSSSRLDKSTRVCLPIHFGRRRKSFALKIDANKGIFLDVPKALSKRQLRSLLVSHETWIRQNYLKLQARLTQKTEPATAPEGDQEGLKPSHQPNDQTSSSAPSCTTLPEGALNNLSNPVQGFLFSVNTLQMSLIADFPQSRIGFEQSRQQTEPLFLGKIDFLGSQKSVWLDNGLSRLKSPCQNPHWIEGESGWQFFAEIENSQTFTDQVTTEKVLYQKTMNPKNWQAFQRFLRGLDLPIRQKQQLIHWSKENLKPIAWQWLIIQSDLKEGFSLHLQANRLVSEHFIDSLPKSLQASVWQWLLQWLLGQCYQKLLESYLFDVLPSYAKQMQVSYKKVEVRSYKSRWGSCKSDGSLQFNWRALQAPLWVLDYLIVHELAHLRHPDHSKQFWHFVSQNYPKTDQAKQVFKQQGARWIQFLNMTYS